MARKGMMVGPVEHRVQGEMLKVGDKAPDFELMAIDRSKRTLADYAGKVLIISTIPSIDTSVCSAQTRRFNAEAANLHEDIRIITVSADLTFALKRYCGAEGISNHETLSCYMDMKFADDYGVHDLDWRVCQRAVFVIDREGIVRHAEYVDVIGHEVNFDKALRIAKELALLNKRNFL